MRAKFTGHDTFPLRYGWLYKAVNHLNSGGKLQTSKEDETQQAIIKLGVGKNMVAFFAEWAAQKLMLWTLDQLVGTATQTAAATTMTANASAMSVMAGLNAFASTAAIPVVGAALAPAAAASAMAATAPMATAVSGLAFAGVFDKGGYIPSGSAGIVSEYGDELVGGTMVYNGSPNSLKVTGREETARMNSSGVNVGGITINSSGNASPNAIARSVLRLLKKGNKPNCSNHKPTTYSSPSAYSP